MKRFLKNLMGMALWVCVLASPALAQEEEEMSRYFREKDWVTWQQGLGNPSVVKKLFIRDKAPLDYDALRHFTALEQLIVYESPLVDLTWLKDYPNLKVLEFQGNGLKTLEGVQVLTGLQEFACNANFVRDLTPLSGLKELTWIQIYDNDIQTIEPLANLPSVTTLDVSRNGIRSLKPIANWTWIKHLAIYNCENLIDISEIANFKLLTDLNISFLPVPNFSLQMLEDHKDLENLRIQGMVHSNEEMKYIMYHPKLEQLTMGKNDNVTTIDSLRFLTKLEYLDIHSNNVADISTVRNFPKLVKFVIYRNPITDLSPLLNCHELRSLFAHELPAKDYGPLYQMGWLQHLSLSQSAFTKEQAMALKKALSNTEVAFY
jgi:internalin A